VDEFPGNSRRVLKPTEKVEKPEPVEEKRVERVVEKAAIRRKKPLSKRFLETFIGGDAKGVLGYVMMDVLLPAAKDTIADAFSQGIERMLFGEVRSTSRRAGYRPNSGTSGYVSYNRLSNGAQVRREEPRPPYEKKRHEFDEIILATRVEAEEVIDRLFDLVEKYGSATVADLYELVGISGNYVNEKWGWNDLRGTKIQRLRTGYLLVMPRPETLD
jgi:hypothetical protein